MSDLIDDTRDEEIAALKAENRRLRAEQAAQGPVRIVPLLPETRAILPSDAQMGELFGAVTGKWPRDFGNVAPDEFGRAFKILATFHRQPEPDASHYVFHWTSAANVRLQAAQDGEVSLLALLAAVLAWGDIPVTDWTLEGEGYLLEFGLNEFTGRLPKDEWRATLRGEFCTLIDKRPKRRVGDGRTPRPSILIDGKPLPDQQRFVGPRYWYDEL